MKKAAFTILALIFVLVVFCLYFVRINSVSDGSNFMPEAKVIDSLKMLEIADEDGVSKFGDASLRREGGNNIIKLKGTPYEMGYQHGKLLADEIREGCVPLFSDPISKNVQYAEKPAWMRWLLMKYLEIKIFAPIEANTPGEYLEEIKGIADGAGLDYRDVFIANFYSDLSMAMVPGVIGKKAIDFGLVKDAGGCSSFAAAGRATAGGKLVFGRNTDYSGQGLWGPNQTIFFCEPEDGYRYVRVSTAGLIKCNSAMNEMGMVIGGHFMGYDGADPAGVSFTIFENMIMRGAKDIDGAAEILRENKRGGAFGFLVADGKTKEAVVFESSPDLLGIRKMERDSIALTNFATTKELEKVDLMARYSLVMRNLMGRYVRLTRLIEENYGRITPALAAEFMSDHIDPILNAERSFGHTVCGANNVTSVIFLPADGFFWTAAGKEPACANEYIGFDFWAEFEEKPSRVYPKILSSYRWKSSAKRDGFSSYMDAYIAYEDDFRRIREALAMLEGAMAQDTEEPAYYRMLARLLIVMGDYEGAEKLLQDSLELPQTLNERGLACLLSGQALDLMGKRDEAVLKYKEVIALKEEAKDDHLSGLNGFLTAYAEKCLERPFSREMILKDIPIAFSLQAGLE
ncbi:MAG: tetratricopeptide repeat protein [Deltaproteobacteria bacterium]|uniref:Tetratricopeptide repeat protein n=1 Tax=Candidatus Zymogenus saltonus TaxID=2844893 RepID=A0A9D8KFP7_9DELT|nr:tetratricopeptide repeat protein [Candidatus Zymogenus saltonus]